METRMTSEDIGNPLLEQEDGGAQEDGVNLLAKSVGYVVTLPSGAPWRRGAKKVILDGVNLEFEAGTCTCILGPSGGGKSTLLEVLGGFNHNRGQVLGELSASSASTGESLPLEDAACLIPQDDVLQAGLSTRETLTFSARIRDAPVERVDDLLRLLGLAEHAETRVGSVDKRGLSGGQRKRVRVCRVGEHPKNRIRRPNGNERPQVSIALELLDNPWVVLVDEPTSGLDSKMAADVVHLLVTLARDSRKTVVCTLHQPTLAMFDRFDAVVLLARGRVAFAGPEPRAAFATELPDGANPAEIFLEWLQDDERLDDMFAKWALLDANRDDADSAPPKPLSQRQRPSRRRPRGSSRVLRQAAILAKRQAIDKLKDPEKFVQSLTVKFMVGLIVGIVWINQAKHTQDSIFPVEGAMFIVSINSMMDTVFVTAMSLTSSRALLIREYRNGYYSLLPRHVAVLAVDSVMAATATLAMACPVYLLVGLRLELLVVVRFLAICVVLACQGCAFGHCVGTVADADFQQVQSLVSPSLTPLILFSGYMIPKAQIPYAFKWLYDASFFQYAMTLFEINQFRGWQFHDCDDFQRRVIGCYQNGSQFLRDNSINPNNMASGFLILALYAIGLFVLSFFFYVRALSRL